MSTVKVERGIPITPQERGRRYNKYPWREMDRDDSFLFPPGTYATLAYTLTRQANKYNHPKKFVTKLVKDEEGHERFRCWRVL